MSLVTGVTLICNIADGEGPEDPGGTPEAGETMMPILEWLRARGFADLRNVAEFAGGSRHPQLCIWAGGYNYFPGKEFAAFVMAQRCEPAIDPEAGVARFTLELAKAFSVRPAP